MTGGGWPFVMGAGWGANKSSLLFAGGGWAFVMGAGRGASQSSLLFAGAGWPFVIEAGRDGAMLAAGRGAKSVLAVVGNAGNVHWVKGGVYWRAEDAKTPPPILDEAHCVVEEMKFGSPAGGRGPICAGLTLLCLRKFICSLFFFVGLLLSMVATNSKWWDAILKSVCGCVALLFLFVVCCLLLLASPL